MSRPLTPGYFTSIHHPGILPTIPPPSSTRPASVNLTTARREIALGNYEIARKQAEVADYNNPLDALQAELAIAAQEKALQEEEEREQRRARRQERKLARALRKLRLQESRSRSKSRSHGSRKATPYASEISASSSDSEGEQPYHQHPETERRPKHSRRWSKSVQASKSSEHTGVRNVSRTRAKTVGEAHADADDSTWEGHGAEHVPSKSDSTRATAYTSSKSLSPGSRGSQPAASTSQQGIQVHVATHQREIPSHSTSSRKPSQVQATIEPIGVPKQSSIDPDRELLHLVFQSSEEFILTHSELVRGGPSNSFLNSWKRFPRQLEEGELLIVKMPADRDAKLFQIIHDYLKGDDIIPLNTKNAFLLCGDYPATMQAHKRLCKEAAKYGIKNLVQEVAAFCARPVEPEFQPAPTYSRRRDAAVRHEVNVRDLGPSASSSSAAAPTRAVITGAAINFMTRVLPPGEFELVYSLVAPLTASAKFFRHIEGCSLDTTSRQLVIEGVLTREECRNVVLDVMYRQVSGSSIHSRTTPETKRRPFTLEHLYKMFLPSRAHELPEVLFDTFVKHSFNNDAEEDEDRRVQNASNPSSRFYLSLPFCTVAMRLDQTQDEEPGSHKTVFEQIHTATQEMLFDRV